MVLGLVGQAMAGCEGQRLRKHPCSEDSPYCSKSHELKIALSASVNRLQIISSVYILCDHFSVFPLFSWKEMSLRCLVDCSSLVSFRCICFLPALLPESCLKHCGHLSKMLTRCSCPLRLRIALKCPASQAQPMGSFLLDALTSQHLSSRLSTMPSHHTLLLQTG